MAVSAPLLLLEPEKKAGKVHQESEAAFARNHDLIMLPTRPAGANVVASLNGSEVVDTREQDGVVAEKLTSRPGGRSFDDIDELLPPPTTYDSEDIPISFSGSLVPRGFGK
jgi:hypothetical protein